MSSWMRKDEKWTEVSLGRCWGRREIGIDFSAVLTLISYWPSFLPSKSTHLSIDWALAPLYGCFNKAHSGASLAVYVLATVLIQPVPVGRAASHVKLWLGATRCLVEVFILIASKPVNGPMQGFSAFSETWAQVWQVIRNMCVRMAGCVSRSSRKHQMCDQEVRQHLNIPVMHFYWR